MEKNIKVNVAANAKDDFLKFVSNIYSEGFDAGMKCAIKQYSDILGNLTANLEKMDTSKSKAKARSLFEETMAPLLDKNDGDQNKIIDFENAKK